MNSLFSIMATGVDRSKYRNPDMPVGYVIHDDIELRYLEGVEIDGVHYVMAPLIYEARLEEREDKDELSDLGFMSESDEDMDDDEVIVKKEKNVVKDTGTKELSLPCKSKKEKEAVSIKKEPIEEDDAEEKKHRKKGHNSSDTTALNVSLSLLGIDTNKHEKKKKLKKIKKESKTDYRSDSDSPTPKSSHHSPSSSRRHSPSSSRRHSPSSSRRHSPSSSRRRSPSSSRRHSPSSERHKKITYSPSPSPERYLDVKIKEEPLEQPQHLFGHYHCEVCNITMSSLLTYNTHINGKRHIKNLKLRNIPEVLAQNIPATVVSEDQSRYPKPPSGVIRKKVQTPANVQQIIEVDIKHPCPGLNFVTEIQGLGGLQYYCSLCDSVCSSSSILSHLTGFKHKLKSVKQFKPGAYEHMQYEPKYKIEKEVQNILYAVEKKQGKGRMLVEVEELAPASEDWSHSMNKPSTSRDYQSRYSQPSTSRGSSRDHSESFHERYDRATVPDTSASDFYCKLCQSHMNSSQMWDAHVRGKRHLTNLKKMPGDVPSKTKTIAVAGRRACLLDRIKHECPDEPFVGLNEVRETEIHETMSYSYQCFLCGSCHTSENIMEHLISLKHRTKYLDHIRFSGKEVIAGMSDSAAYSLVRDMCIQVEAEEGSGNPAVHISKSTLFK